MKYVIGLPIIIFIVILLIGPMFLFSSFNFLGDLNPVSRVNLEFSLNIVNSDLQSTDYKLFSTTSIEKEQDGLPDEFYESMGFSENRVTRIYMA